MKKLKRLPVAQKTWTRFKTNFTEAHQELREELQKIGTAGYRKVKSVVTVDSQTAVALPNITDTTISYRNNRATLTETNAKLVKDITDLTKKLAELMPKTPKKENKKRDGSGYCWLCGDGVNHESKTCRQKELNNKDEATAEYIMGVSIWT